MAFWGLFRPSRRPTGPVLVSKSSVHSSLPTYPGGASESGQRRRLKQRQGARKQGEQLRRLLHLLMDFYDDVTDLLDFEDLLT